MKKIIVILFILFSLQTVFSQDTSIISGQLFDQETKITLAFANVTILNSSNNKLITGAISDENGRFEIQDVPIGNYKIQFSFVGYSTKEQKLITSELTSILDLGKIELEPSAEQLSEVEIIGKQATTNANLSTKTLNLSNNIAQSGGSVLDAMKTMPGVTFDQDGKVILRGSDKVVVLIDGKQSSLTGFGNQKGLGNIPAANIEKIEIINNPSAKYDANGYAGIINIIYKKEKTIGFNGDLGLSFGLGALGKRKEDTKTDLGSYTVNPKLIPSLNLNYKTKNLNYFLQSEFIVQEALPNNEFTTRTYPDNSKIISQVPENRKQFKTIIAGGVDWEIDDANSITFSGLYDREKHTDTSQVAYINLNTNNRNRYYNWREVEITRFINASANYKHKFVQPGHTLTASVQYTQGLEDESYFLNDSSSVRIGRDATNILAIEHTTNLTTDYTKPLKNGRFELGLKTRIRKLPVEYNITPGVNTIIYPNLGSFSDWGENLFAGYFNYLLEKEKYSLEAGLRAEQTNVFYDLDPANTYYPNNDKYNYFKLFPSFRYTYKVNDKNKISAFYNKRIDRPGEPELRVFPKYDDPELLKVGNAYLRPQLTDAFEVAHKYSWDTGSLFSAVYHRIINDHYMRIYSLDESNPDYQIVNKIYQNTGKATNTGIEILFSQDISSAWKISSSINVYSNKISAYQGALLFPYERTFTVDKSSNTAGDAKLNNEFSLPKNWAIQLTGIYYSKKNIVQGKELARGSIDFGFKKNIWDKKGEFTLSASDIFNTFAIRQEINGDGFSAVYENYYETQIVRLGFKYKF